MILRLCNVDLLASHLQATTSKHKESFLALATFMLHESR
jgi:hypothetical protein